MTPDDPRHGTANGYINGRCREACCREATRVRQADYRKQRYCYGPLTVPTLGATRRLQALAAIGWSASEIGRRIGRSEANVIRWRSGVYPRLTLANDRSIRDLYRALCMTPPPPGRAVTFTRNHAQRLGWYPPLAYDDIDDPDEMPSLDAKEEDAA